MEKNGSLDLKTRQIIAAEATNTAHALYTDGRITEEQMIESIFKAYESLGINLKPEEEIIG